MCVVLFAIGFAPAGVTAADADFQQRFEHAASAYRTAVSLNDYDPLGESAALFEQVATETENAFGRNHLSTAQALYWLSECRFVQADYATAKELIQDVLTIRSALLPPDHPDVADARNKLAVSLRRLDKIDEAEDNYKQAIGALRGVAGAAPPILAETLNNLGYLYFKAERYDEALPLLQESRALFDSTLGKGHPRSIDPIDNIANLYAEQKKFDEATPLFIKAISLREMCCGAEHKSIGYFANQAGWALNEQEKYDEAIPYLQRSISVREKHLGPMHKFTATPTGNLAVAYKGLKQYEEAVRLYLKKIDIQTENFGATSTEVAWSTKKLGDTYKSAERYEEAEDAYKRSLKTYEHIHGPEHKSVAYRIADLGYLYEAQKRFEDAAPYYAKSLWIREKLYGKESEKIAHFLENYADFEEKRQRYHEAITLYERALAIREKTNNPDYGRIATVYNWLGLIFDDLGQYKKAEKAHAEALRLDTQVFGVDSVEAATSMLNLASAYKNLGRYDEAGKLYRRSIAIEEKERGSNDKGLATNLNNYAVFLMNIGEYREAEEVLRRCISIKESNFGKRHASTASSYHNLATTLKDLGKYEDALQYAQMAVEFWSDTKGVVSPSLASGLRNLASIYTKMGQYDKAIPIEIRGLTITKDIFGNNHPEVAVSLNNLALSYDELGRRDEALKMLYQALEIDENNLGPNHPGLITVLDNIASLEKDLGNIDRARSLFQRALKIGENSFSGDNENLVVLLANMARFEHKLKNYEAALQLELRALGIAEQAYGDNHPTLATIHSNLSLTLKRLGKEDEYLHHSKMALEITKRTHKATSFDLASRTDDFGQALWSAGRYYEALDTFRESRTLYLNHIHLEQRENNKTNSVDYKSFRFPLFLQIYAETLLRDSLKEVDTDTFEAAQLARYSPTTSQFNQIETRLQTTNEQQHRLARNYEDALKAWRATEQAIAATVAQAGTGAQAKDLATLTESLKQREDDLKRAKADLFQAFPRYGDLMSFAPVSIDEVQRLLKPGEALINYIKEAKISIFWAITPKDYKMVVLESPLDELENTVAALRRTLDPTTMNIAYIEDVPAFDLKAAYQIYSRYIAPLRDTLHETTKLYIVPDGPLKEIPFSLLVTAPTEETIADFSAYKRVPWLINDYALVTLPSVSTLRALRSPQQQGGERRPFIGFGDPLLKGTLDRPAEAADLFTSRNVANADAVRTYFPPLPETARELETLAKNLGAANDALYLREQASETVLKSLPLSNYQVIAFATHGVKAGEIDNLPQSALILTPPTQSSVADDGILTASEIAQLNLNADLVVLSACNTGATTGSESFSGLMKSFFFAGSRSLLVSHWPVHSDAAVAITTEMFRSASNDNTIGYAEAMRRSMRKLIQNDQDPYMAHPMFWAPFNLVGDAK